MFCRSALLFLICKNRVCLSQLIQKLNSMERGALFRHFCVSKVVTTAHAHKSGVIFHIFPRAFKQKKIKALWLKMTKIASKGSCLNFNFPPFHYTCWSPLSSHCVLRHVRYDGSRRSPVALSWHCPGPPKICIIACGGCLWLLFTDKEYSWSKAWILKKDSCSLSPSSSAPLFLLRWSGNNSFDFDCPKESVLQGVVTW